MRQDDGKLRRFQIPKRSTLARCQRRKPFSSSSPTRRTVLTSLFSLVKKSLVRREPTQVYQLQSLVSSALACKYQTGLKGLARRDLRFSFVRSVNDEGKQFCKTVNSLFCSPWDSWDPSLKSWTASTQLKIPGAMSRQNPENLRPPFRACLRPETAAEASRWSSGPSPKAVRCRRYKTISFVLDAQAK